MIQNFITLFWNIVNPLDNILITNIAKKSMLLARIVNVLYWGILQLVVIYVGKLNPDFLIVTTSIALSLHTQFSKSVDQLDETQTTEQPTV